MPSVAVVMSPTFSEFEALSRARGYDEVLERTWPPSTVLDTHRHPFALQALVVQGELWLTVGTETRHLSTGDTFELDADVPHAERYGAAGATYWVARRNRGA
jgi:mannose-6-phosphate isomerase-like protein (cupin superfamily)